MRRLFPYHQVLAPPHETVALVVGRRRSFLLLLLLFYLRERQVWACLISFMKPFIRCICRKSSTAPFLFVSAAREKGKHPQFVIIIIIFFKRSHQIKRDAPHSASAPTSLSSFFFTGFCVPLCFMKCLGIFYRFSSC